jgi:hypothetical protein
MTTVDGTTENFREKARKKVIVCENDGKIEKRKTNKFS